MKGYTTLLVITIDKKKRHRIIPVTLSYFISLTTSSLTSYCIHKTTLYFIKHNNANTQQNNHETETIAKLPPAESSHTHSPVFKSF